MLEYQTVIEDIGALCALSPCSRVQFDADYEKRRQSVDTRLKNGAAIHLQWRVLLADDDAPFRMIHKHIIELSGFSVTVVENGREALDALARGGHDMALLDINMPEMDGLAATREIRASDEAYSDIPIIGISTDVSEEDVDRMISAGFDGVMSKPVRRNDLFRVILASMSNRTGADLDHDRGRTSGD